MEAKELRVGNIIGFINSHHIVLPNDIVDCHNGLWNNVDTYPIKLTEELLLSFGFEESEYGFFNIDIPKKYKAKISFSRTMNCQVCQSGLGFNVCVQFVHQLQNLYFSLTGMELTIKNP